MSAILNVEKLSHQYTRADSLVLDQVNLEIGASELVSVSGSSGCGKTTLLLCCGAMQSPTQGRISINGQNVFDLSNSSRNQFRAQQIGYVFQTLQLVPYLSVLNNMRLVHGVDSETARHWLMQLGVDEFRSRMPGALSHGQRQRVALARAIAHRPALLIADEPTGNLDPENTQRVFQTLREFADNGGAVLLASHHPSLNNLADRHFQLVNGKLELASQTKGT